MVSPQEIDRRNWDGLFGMTEMELAAAVILAKAKKFGRWVSVYLEDFQAEDRQEKEWLTTGFLELVYGHWLTKSLEPWCYNGGFFPTEEFVRKLAG